MRAVPEQGRAEMKDVSDQAESVRSAKESILRLQASSYSNSSYSYTLTQNTNPQPSLKLKIPQRSLPASYILTSNPELSTQLSTQHQISTYLSLPFTSYKHSSLFSSAPQKAKKNKKLQKNRRIDESHKVT